VVPIYVLGVFCVVIFVCGVLTMVCTWGGVWFGLCALGGRGCGSILVFSYPIYLVAVWWVTEFY